MTGNQFRRRREKLFPAPSQPASRALAAEALGVTLNCINHWEYGDRKVPKYAVKLLECLEAQQERDRLKVL
jgi:DNA-binding transcriptional regulator YiaG